MAFKHREESVNTQLALILSSMGVMAEAETLLFKGQHRPDVLFTLYGLRVAIEGKFSGQASAENKVLDDARNRVNNGVAHIAVAVIYPEPLRETPTMELGKRLAETVLRFQVISEFSAAGEWFEGAPAEMLAALRRIQSALAQDNLVEKIAKALSMRLEGIADLWSGQAGTCDRLSRLLGFQIHPSETPEQSLGRRRTSAKVAALVIANAMIFQEQLSQVDERIRPLAKLDKESDPAEAAKTHWTWIWENINYVPIFQLGERVLEELPLSQNTGAAFRALLSEAKAICLNQAALRHDLMGRIYHWLLHYAKFLGTYYTAVSSATLLLKLALAKPWPLDFGSPAELAEFKVADLASGTGTLLMASAQAITDAYIASRAKTGRPIDTKDLSTLHKTLMQNVLHGYDVLPTAMHLTASTLAMLAPEVSFVRMNLYVMPLGLDGNVPKLGSLDFMDGQRVSVQIALDHSQMEAVKTSAGLAHAAIAQVPELDLCVMNPPFVRSVGGNLLFGSLPDERGDLQKELKRRIKAAAKRGYPASATAGLGSVFVAAADMHLKPGGRLAFVLPIALASGEAWAETRKLIADKYHLETVIVSHDGERPNFSENTELSELLFIARKRKPKEVPEPTVYVNLWRNPRSIHEALDLAERIRRAEPAQLEGQGFASIKGLAGKIGEAVTLPAATGSGNWTGMMFAQTELLRSFCRLNGGELYVPGQKPTCFPICTLAELGSIGPDRKRIHEGFKTSEEDWSPYPGFWNHDSKAVTTIKQSSNIFLVVWTASPRGPAYGPHLWERSGRILLTERLRTNTHRLLAVGFNRNVLGNTWWALKTSLDEKQEKALLLWLNGSAALLLTFGRRVTTQGAWMQIKQPAWETMPVLDVRALSTVQLDALAEAYDQHCQQSLDALAKLDTDPVRKGIDDAISTALELPDMANLRAQLAREPGLKGVQANLKQGQENAIANTDDGAEQPGLF